MATAEEIAALRLLIAEPGPAAPYDDVTLGNLLDASDSPYKVASQIWTYKAAGSASFVDMSEGGSSRKLGDVHEQYLSMADRMALLAIDAVPADGLGPGLRITRLTRP